MAPWAAKADNAFSATQRSFFMTAVVLIAVIVDRRAVTFRTLVVAAMLVLVMCIPKPWCIRASRAWAHFLLESELYSVTTLNSKTIRPFLGTLLKHETRTKIGILRDFRSESPRLSPRPTESVPGSFLSTPGYLSSIVATGCSPSSLGRRLPQYAKPDLSRDAHAANHRSPDSSA
jgi:hypothetical protein